MANKHSFSRKEVQMIEDIINYSEDLECMILFYCQFKKYTYILFLAKGKLCNLHEYEIALQGEELELFGILSDLSEYKLQGPPEDLYVRQIIEMFWVYLFDIDVMVRKAEDEKEKQEVMPRRSERLKNRNQL